MPAPKTPPPDPSAQVLAAPAGAGALPPHRLTIKVGGRKAAEMARERVRYLGNRASRRRRG